MGRIKRRRKTKKKAVYFTIDAIIAALIFVTGMLLITRSYISDQPTVTLNYLSQDVINVLGEMKVGEINNSLVEELIGNGTIDKINNTILEQIGAFWAAGEIELAEDLIKNITPGMIPVQYGFGVYINDEAIYRRSDIPEDNVVVARKIISGIEKDRPVNGYIARAIAHEVVRNMTLIIPFSPEGSGWYSSGYINLTKKFLLNGSITLQSARFYFSGHIGSGDDDAEITFNNDTDCHFDMNNITIVEEESGSGRGVYGYFDIPFDCIETEGYNTILLQLHNWGYHGHLHPGSFLKLRYLDGDYVITEIDATVSKRYYFDDMVSYGSSNNGLFQVLPFFIPPGASDISVSMNIATENVRDYTGSECCEWSGLFCVLRCRDIDYQVFFNSGTAFDIEDHPSQDHTYSYTPSQMSSNVQEGTNLIGVYVNSYGDDRWGNMETTIYSDQENDPENSSFVEVNYTYTPPVYGGTIEIIDSQEFGGDWDTPKETSFSFPSQAEWPSNVFTHLVQIYSSYVRERADTVSPPGNEIFLSPAPRLVPTTIYLPDNIISTDSAATNYIRVEDTYGSPRDIGPNSTIEIGFYVKSFVGYGEVFFTEEDAAQDAEERLEAVVGPYVSLEDVEFDNISITDVPSLWGPAVIGVQIWT